MAIYRILAASVAATCVATAFGEQPDRDGAAANDIDRGKYIVEGVAHCWTCHTPRDQQGQPDRQRWLLGGPVPFAPARPTEEWAELAPRLAGSPPGTDDQIVTLLTTGIARTGRPPRPPMPQFRMTRPDAQAVLGYLKSLTARE
jgi:mono/diheme cytochrome c family protein